MTKAPVTSTWHECNYCRRSLPYIPARAGGAIGKENVLMGRSRSGGWVCRACYELPVATEADWREVAKADLARRVAASKREEAQISNKPSNE